MLKTILQRLSQGVIVVFCLLAITFTLVRLMPGGPFGSDKALTEEQLQRNREYHHLDEPIYYQFYMYLGKVVQGDLNDSINQHQPGGMGRPI